MRIIFRADASLVMGTGHVMRCLTLADTFDKKVVQVEFICRNHPGNLITLIREKGYKVHVLPRANLETTENSQHVLNHSAWLNCSQLEDAQQCCNILIHKKTDWLIVDHYGIDRTWELPIKEYCNKLMVIDDLVDRMHVCDLLLDQTYGRDKEAYKLLVPIHCQVLTGSSYALLRKEFNRWREYSLKRRDGKNNTNTILISMGGVDPENVTGAVLHELNRCKMPENSKVIVVMGGTSMHLEKVKALSKTLSIKTEIKVNVSNMAEIMANSDLAIGAAGTTSWERCCLGLPTLVLVLADNQKTIAKNLHDNKIIYSLSSIKELCPSLNMIKTELDLISINARNITDGRGAELIVEALNG